ncbi:MAG: RNA polymerase sigma factor [Candidatus Dormibacteria bacterium]
MVTSTSERLRVGADDAYQPGSKADFDRLYQATYPRVYATLVTIMRDRAAAEDCAQEAYLRAFKAWKGWKQDAPAEAWVHRIALNVAFSHGRRERLRDVGELLRRLGRPDPPPDPTAEVGSPLLAALRTLPPKQAAVVVLRHLHGYTNREIAASLGIPEATAASRLATAKARLRTLLDERIEAGMVTLGEQGVPSAE